MRPGPGDVRAMRRRLGEAIERAIAALDALDGDPDLEAACEDEGAQCDDEGATPFEVCDWPERMDQTHPC